MEFVCAECHVRRGWIEQSRLVVRDLCVRGVAVGRKVLGREILGREIFRLSLDLYFYLNFRGLDLGFDLNFGHIYVLWVNI